MHPTRKLLPELSIKRIDSIGKIYEAVDEGKKELARRALAAGVAESPANEPVWYRSHSRAVYTLRPSLHRTANGIESEANLYRIYHSFKPDLNGWQTLFEMQHFSVPTRLLDWTTDLATALYFAVNDEDFDVPSIYLLHPCLLNWEALHGDPSRILPFSPNEPRGVSSACPYEYPQNYDPEAPHRLPIALRPAIKHDRIRAQNSMFTTHGSAREPIEELCPQSVAKIEITVPRHEAMLLRDLGRESRDIFPDEAGMSRTLIRRLGLKPIPDSERVIEETVRRIWHEDHQTLQNRMPGPLHMQGLSGCALGADYFDRASSSQIEAWLTGGSEPVLFVVGPAASGKTNLLADLVLKDKRYLKDLFLFCRLNDFRPGEQMLGEFLAALLAQMAEVNGQPSVHIDEFTLESMISKGRIILILDGLDELVRIQGADCAAYLGTQLRRLMVSGGGRARIIIACRDHIVRNLENKLPPLLKNAKSVPVGKIPVEHLKQKWGLQDEVARFVADVTLLCRVLRLAKDPGSFKRSSDLWNFWLDEAARNLAPPVTRQQLLNQLGIVATEMLKERDDFLSNKQLHSKPEMMNLIKGLADLRSNPCPLFVKEIDGKWRFAHQAIREYVLASNMSYGLGDPASDNVFTATSALDYESAETYKWLQRLLADETGNKHISTKCLPCRGSIPEESRWNNFARNYFEAVGMLGAKNSSERRVAIAQALDTIEAAAGVRLKTQFNAARCLTRLHPTSPQPYCDHASKDSWPELEDPSVTVAYGYAVRGFHKTRLEIDRHPPEIFQKELEEIEEETDWYSEFSADVSNRLLTRIEGLALTRDLRLGERFVQVNCAHALIRWLHARDESLCIRVRDLMRNPKVQRQARMNVFLALCVHDKPPEEAPAVLLKEIAAKPRLPRHFAGDINKLCGAEDDPEDDG